VAGIDQLRCLRDLIAEGAALATAGLWKFQPTKPETGKSETAKPEPVKSEAAPRYREQNRRELDRLIGSQR